MASVYMGFWSMHIKLLHTNHSLSYCFLLSGLYAASSGKFPPLFISMTAWLELCHIYTHEGDGMLEIIKIQHTHHNMLKIIIEVNYLCMTSIFLGVFCECISLSSSKLSEQDISCFHNAQHSYNVGTPDIK